jgi:hypothetical protein
VAAHHAFRRARGLLVGLLIAFVWVQGLDSLLPGITFKVPPTSTVGVIVVAVGLGALAAILPAAPRRAGEAGRSAEVRVEPVAEQWCARASCGDRRSSLTIRHGLAPEPEEVAR